MSKGPEKLLLLVATEPKHAFHLQRLIQSSGLSYSVTLALTTDEAKEGARRSRWTTVVVDARWNHAGMEVLVQQLRTLDRLVPIVVLANTDESSTLWSHYDQFGVRTIESQQFDDDPAVLMKLVEDTVSAYLSHSNTHSIETSTPPLSQFAPPATARPIATLRINTAGHISHIDRSAWSEPPSPDQTWLLTTPSTWFDSEDGSTVDRWVHHHTSHQSAILSLKSSTAERFWVQCEWIPMVNHQENTLGCLVLFPLKLAQPSHTTTESGLSPQKIRELHSSALRKFSGMIVGHLANPLTAVMGHAELLLLDASLDSENVSQVQTIVKEARAVAEVLSRLGRLANPPALENDLLGLSGLLAKTVDLLAADPSTKQVSFRLDLPNDLPLALFDYQQLQSAFSQLILAATKAAQGPRKVVSVTAKATTTSLIVEIMDNGPPIEKNHPLQIIDPFAGIGTYRQQVDKLALALAYSVILEHGGRLFLDNLPDNTGVLCTVEIPRTESDHRTVPLKTIPTPIVIVVEESEQIIRLIKRSLRALSIHTVVLSNPHVAVDRLLGGGVLAVMCSLDMVDHDLPVRLVDANSDTPGILRRFITLSPGQPTDAWMNIATEHAMPNLTKPFSLSEIRNHIERILQLGKVPITTIRHESSSRSRTKLSLVPDSDG
ncbi:MAG: HAMP domain-containing histidine kinase [Myxococcales bacterium]|nr:HAMP domain-containing histidine kinase [Myxococcales bacterium]